MIAPNHDFILMYSLIADVAPYANDHTHDFQYCVKITNPTVLIVALLLKHLDWMVLDRVVSVLIQRIPSSVLEAQPNQ
jgi:hypothetical protein